MENKDKIKLAKQINVVFRAFVASLIITYIGHVMYSESLFFFRRYLLSYILWTLAGIIILIPAVLLFDWVMYWLKKKD